MVTDSIVYENFSSDSPHSTVGPYRAIDYWQLPEGEPVELLRGRMRKVKLNLPLAQVLSLVGAAQV